MQQIPPHMTSFAGPRPSRRSLFDDGALVDFHAGFGAAVHEVVQRLAGGDRATCPSYREDQAVLSKARSAFYAVTR